MRDEDFAAQLASLRRDFHLREETHQYEYEGKWRTFNTRTIEFAFSCGERFSLVIDYQPTANECGRELYLVDALYKTRSKMGWIDLARWHPYGLRVEELDALLAFWERWDPRWQGSAVPLLLLCHFVGLADDEARDALTARANAALQSLNLEEAFLSQMSPSTFRTAIIVGKRMRSSAGFSRATNIAATRCGIVLTWVAITGLIRLQPFNR